MHLKSLVLGLILSTSIASAQEFQSPLDLVLGHGNPFDDPNYHNQLEIPGGDFICAPSFVLERDSAGRPISCGPLDFFDNPKSHYLGCYQSLQASGDYSNQLVIEVESLKARLTSCKKSRGRKC
jgi:hypothetical protein